MKEMRRRFCEEYIVDLNATQAAVRAGYSQRSAYSQGQRLLKIDEIQKLIGELQASRSKRTEITADRVLDEIAKIAFIDLSELGSCKASDKLKALELLCRHLGMLKDNSDADSPALEKLDKILEEICSTQAA